MQFMFIDENLEVEDQAIEPQDDMDNQQNQRNPGFSQPLAVRVGYTSQRRTLPLSLTLPVQLALMLKQQQLESSDLRLVLR